VRCGCEGAAGGSGIKGGRRIGGLCLRVSAQFQGLQDKILAKNFWTLFSSQATKPHKIYCLGQKIVISKQGLIVLKHIASRLQCRKIQR